MIGDTPSSITKKLFKPCIPEERACHYPGVEQWTVIVDFTNCHWTNSSKRREQLEHLQTCLFGRLYLSIFDSASLRYPPDFFDGLRNRQREKRLVSFDRPLLRGLANCRFWWPLSWFITKQFIQISALGYQIVNSRHHLYGKFLFRQVAAPVVSTVSREPITGHHS
jgi:hypothetical protein